MTLSDEGGANGPAGTGIGLREPHVGEILASRPALPWLEVHPENYMTDGALRVLERVRERYPISLHGVGLSLGSDQALDRRHLRRLRAVVDRVAPCLVSEHLSWSTAGGAYLNHLLPVPYTEDALAVFVRHVEEAQDALGRSILIENPSSYLRFADSPIPEPEFLAEVARRSGARLLLDVNNAYVTAWNLGLDAVAYIDALPPAAVGEIHLAGHAPNDADGRTILIDDHGSRVAEPVWALYARAIRRLGPIPTLIEWDTDVPPLGVLLDEARAADRVAAAACQAPGEAAGARAA